MLACVVAIPVVALSGSSLPKTVKELMEGKWPGGGSGELKPNVSPQFEPVPSTSVNLTAPTPPSTPPAAIDPSRAWPTGAQSLAASPAAAPQNLPAAEYPGEPIVRQLPPPPARTGTSPMLDPFVQQAQSTADLRETSAPSGPMERPRELRPTSDSIPAAPAPTESVAERGALTQYQQWLQQQGATYLALETWGSQQQLFRCHCQMAMGGNPNCTRHFEATSADPLQAMAQVVAQVEAWRTQATGAARGPG